MRIAFVIYEGVTVLDFIGAYDPLSRLNTMGFMPDLTCDVCALQKQIRTFEGLEILPNEVGVDLSSYDYVIVPGGNAIVDLVKDSDFMGWLGKVGPNTVMAAVCGGALLLGCAGLLRGRTATTHPSLSTMLEKMASHVSQDRVVEDENIITARGVTSSIDLGLYLCEKIAGAQVRERIQMQMDYPNYSCK